MTSEAPRIIREVISLAEVRELAEQGFGEMVKGVGGGNRSRSVYDPAIRSSIRRIVDALIRR